METTLTFDIDTDHLVDEVAQRDPHLFEELHYDLQAVKQVIETLLRILILPSDLVVPPSASPDGELSVFHLPQASRESTAPDSSVWLP